MATFVHPPSMPMYVSFYPYNNNIIAIGMDDSTVLIYDARANEINQETVRNRGSVSPRSETLPCLARVESCIKFECVVQISGHDRTIRRSSAFGPSNTFADQVVRSSD
ncbi:hypothetical protein CsSME_00000759 [Camellia sinensis var. sinensis]